MGHKERQFVSQTIYALSRYDLKDSRVIAYFDSVDKAKVYVQEFERGGLTWLGTPIRSEFAPIDQHSGYRIEPLELITEVKWEWRKSWMDDVKLDAYPYLGGTSETTT